MIHSMLSAMRFTEKILFWCYPSIYRISGVALATYAWSWNHVGSWSLRHPPHHILLIYNLISGPQSDYVYCLTIIFSKIPPDNCFILVNSSMGNAEYLCSPPHTLVSRKLSKHLVSDHMMLVYVWHHVDRMLKITTKPLFSYIS